MSKAAARTVAAHRRLIVRRIFHAFESLIYRLGYDAVTLADIAKESGMARTAIYTYFPDKESLLLAYTDHEMDEYFSRLRIELYGVDDPLDRLDIYIRLHLRYVSAHHLPAGRALRSVLSKTGYDAMRRHAETLETVLSSILADAATERLIPASVAEDHHTLGMVMSCLSSINAGSLSEKELQTAIESARTFIFRAVGFDRAEEAKVDT